MERVLSYAEMIKEGTLGFFVHCADISGFALNRAERPAAICEAMSLISSSEGFFASSKRTAGEYDVTVITGPYRLSGAGGFASS